MILAFTAIFNIFFYFFYIFIILAERILNEQDELSKNFIKWEKLKASGANISERMDLARIDEQIEIMLQKRRYLKEINGQS